MFARYNPHKYSINGKINKKIKRVREEELINWINNLQFNANSPGLQIQYMYYDCDSENKIKIHDDPEYFEDVKKMCLQPII